MLKKFKAFLKERWKKLTLRKLKFVFFIGVCSTAIAFLLMILEHKKHLPLIVVIFAIICMSITFIIIPLFAICKTIKEEEMQKERRLRTEIRELFKIGRRKIVPKRQFGEENIPLAILNDIYMYDGNEFFAILKNNCIVVYGEGIRTYTYTDYEVFLQHFEVK